jgi:hypothetical protein
MCREPHAIQLEGCLLTLVAIVGCWCASAALAAPSLGGMAVAFLPLVRLTSPASSTSKS